MADEEIPTVQDIVTSWIRKDPTNAADTIIELAGYLTAGQRTALRTRITDELKVHNQAARDRAARANDDAVADTLNL